MSGMSGMSGELDRVKRHSQLPEGQRIITPEIFRPVKEMYGGPSYNESDK